MSCATKIYPVKRGDTATPFQDHLEIDGVSLDLAGGTVKFVMKTKSGTMLENAFGTVLQTGSDQDKSEPNVEYLPPIGTMYPVGLHNVEWQCETATGRKVTLPRGRVVNGEIIGAYHQVQVIDTLTPVDESTSSASSVNSSSSNSSSS